MRISRFFVLYKPIKEPLCPAFTQNPRGCWPQFWRRVRNRFPTIPVNVTLNEYIDAAKYYSTPKSSTFINGILDAVVQDLKEENKLVKVPLAKGARKDADDDDDDE